MAYIPTLTKQPAEDRLFEMEFVGLLGPDETLNGVISVTATPTGLTLSGAPTYEGSIAKQRISGGTNGTTYKVTFVVTTSEGNTLEGEGKLKVRDL